MERWTRTVIANRKKVIAAWLVLFVLGGYGASHVGSLLSNRFSVPGSDAERGRELLKERFNERGDGAFTLVFQTSRPVAQTAAFRRRATAIAAKAASPIEGAQAEPAVSASPTVAYVQINTPLENADAANKTDAVRAATPRIPGVRTYLSGFPAITNDTKSIYNEDLAKGETIALPVALLVMAFMFGTLGGIVVPFAFAAVTIPSTLGAVWIFAHFMNMAVYVTNIVTLIGLAIAIDYSMLVVFRYREELEKGHDPREALVETMKTAGRATLFSGAVVAVGLALLVLMPVPFMRSMGVGGLLVPLFSIAASATFLPALLAMMGTKVNRLRVIPRSILAHRAEGRTGVWHRLARSIMRRPIVYLVLAGGLMVGLALPALGLHLTSGDNRGVPLSTESTRGYAVLKSTLGPGALAPNQIVVETGRPGGAFSPPVVAAEGRLVAQLRGDPQVQPSTILVPAQFPPGPQGRLLARRAHLVDARGEVLQMRVAGKQDAGTRSAQNLVHRIRDRYIPRAGFPASTEVVLTGAPAFGVDFVDVSYGAFPWLVVAVLVLTYLLLLRAFRSLVLPLKAVLLNLLSVSATYGVLVLVFAHGGHSLLGLKGLPQIEAWIPIFLFAMLFGLSMDYEVFLLSRIREEWDRRHDNEEAVAYGLEHTGRIITAAALIMIAAFSGFTAGSFVGLQQFGVGLSAAILLDATIVRAILVPALMKLLGDWNWYLPKRIERILDRTRPRPAQVKAGG
ncbi:MAG TPA: MMPL family transporter [Solirubrobacterales bacterium]|nr:MMPL family transporter [Solirubrobacterales bacterium]